ncbi:MAG TPA: ATP-binding protein [Steroidobacteraceae bacterium]|nr:ATP-binding protein [Steroidobacteraceae bacterium]
MKTKSGSTRNSRRGLYVGLILALPAALALEGVGFWLALGPQTQLAATAITATAIAGIAAGALLTLGGGTLLAASLLRRPRVQGEPASPFVTAPRPGSEEAAALAHARRMEALGLLAGGVAHDFNNLLHVIRNSLEILERRDPQVDTYRYLEMIRRSADQAGALTRQLLAFSRRQPVEVRPIDPNDLVAQMVELLRHSLGEKITVETVLGGAVGSVTTDAGQLETALLNLAINARDAMSQAGLLTIETANAVLDESFAGIRGPCATDQYVMIAVSDTGTGMPPEVAARACEPFFTTKEPGQGTGLGLSQVAGFVQQSGGHVRIASEPGKGTTVRLYLPKSGRYAERSLPRQPDPESPPRSIRQATKCVALAVGAGPQG